MKNKQNNLFSVELSSAHAPSFNLGRFGLATKGIIQMVSPAWIVSFMVVLLAQVTTPAVAACIDSTIELATLNGQNGIVINGESGSISGSSVSTAGDVNGDGFDDVLIGAPRTRDHGTNSGSAYVLFGGRNVNTSNQLDLTTLDGQNGFIVHGAQQIGDQTFPRGHLLGTSVSTAGDVNGDGFDDLLIGAPGGRTLAGVNTGDVFVVFGASNFGSNGPLEVPSLDGRGFVIVGPTPDFGTRIGFKVSSAGDVNGDGFDDLFFTGGSGAYVVFGSSNIAASGAMQVSELDGSNGFEIRNEANAILSISPAGDINHDGIDDLLIGDNRSSFNGSVSGASYVVFGSRGTVSGGAIELSSLNGNNGFVLYGLNASDEFGAAVSAAGDVNSDGVDDFVVGAPFDRSASAYVVFGADGIGADGVLNPSSLNGHTGFAIKRTVHRDKLGSAVSGAGDFNGDGIDDLLIGAATASPNDRFSAGTSYVVFGSNNVGTSGALQLSALNSLILNGGGAGDRSGTAVSAAGDVNGDGTNDILIGAPYTDRNFTNNIGSTYLVFGQLSSDPVPVNHIAQLSAGIDDAEEDSNGLISRASNKLNLGELLTGVRFPAVNIPAEATITCAYIQFEAAGTNANQASFQLVGEASDDSPLIRFRTNNLSFRPTTNASATWVPGQWSLDDAGIPQQTSDLSAIVQEIIARPGWSLGNALTMMIENGTGRRQAVSYNLDSSAAAQLYVGYTLTNAVNLISEVRVANKNDDAEESDNTDVQRKSSDLELGFNKTKRQTVGIRFNGINIPRGSTITRAYIQFQTDETDSIATNLLIAGEATDYAMVYRSTNGNISTRVLTQASAVWTPPPWKLVGEAGIDQQTPDISTIVQEVIDRPGWQNGNALGIVITGSGQRTAESYDGEPNGAPLLHLEYSLP